MYASAQAIGCFGVDGAKSHEASERRLNMPSRTAKPVIEIEMTERSVQIVAPHQNDNAAAKPYAFRISGGAIDRLRRLDELVGLALIVLGCVRRGSRIVGRWLTGLILGAKITTLGDRTSDTSQQRKSEDGETA